MKKQLFRFLLSAALAAGSVSVSAREIYFCGDSTNNLYNLLKTEGFDIVMSDDAGSAIKNAAKGSAVIITSPSYPEVSTEITKEMVKTASEKGLRVYAEYVSSYPGVEIADSLYHGSIERGVVSSDFFKPALEPMSIFGVNDCHIYPAKVDRPLLSYARVAGFDTATFGLTDTDVYPLLWKNGNFLVASSCLSNFVTARQAPLAGWHDIWTGILRYLCKDKKIEINSWPSDPRPTFSADAEITAADRRRAIERGAEWLGKARLLLHPSWRDTLYAYQGDGVTPWGPSINREFLIGDGSCGVLEGHGAAIDCKGKQNYRYWLRADVQGETAFLLAAAAKSTGDGRYSGIAENVLDYLFYSGDYINGTKKNPADVSYGLIGWSKTHDYVYYNDDNARCVLGAIGASSLMDNHRWNKFIVDNIMANFNLSNRYGFLPDRFEQPELSAKGRSHYTDSDFVLPHPHFESWMWACYLWLYDKTGYKPLLDKARTAIEMTMAAYPDEWKWTNGIQQERARMILPLAWLVRVDDTPQHRQWLDMVVSRLLENQDACGAIREELGGDAFGMYGKASSNRDYGVREAPLIGKNGDPVADMLYTCNFAFFALNEASHATGESRYKEAVDKLGDFLVRIQAKGDNHPDIDGAWMRAFDYNRWDYWASNADSGWGAWCTLSGWIQSWIVGTLALVDSNTSYWDTTGSTDVTVQMNDALKRLELANAR